MLLLRSGRTGPPLLDAVNRYPLSIFLVANLLTGAINLSIDTTTVSVTLALAICAVHIVLVCAAAVTLDGPRHSKKSDLLASDENRK